MTHEDELLQINEELTLHRLELEMNKREVPVQAQSTDEYIHFWAARVRYLSTRNSFLEKRIKTLSEKKARKEEVIAWEKRVG